MSNALLVLLGAVIAYSGVLLGIARERRRRPEPPKTPDPICGCEHDLAMHDPETNRCHHEERVARFRESDNKFIGYYQGTCPCRQYVGPRPIDQVFLP